MKPDEVQEEAYQAVADAGWTIAEEKTRLSELPRRHPRVLGLLVDRDTPRLPKNYRNRLRMMRHMLENAELSPKSRERFAGHLAYAASIG